MWDLDESDVLTRVARYNLIRRERMIYIDVHERLHGNLAGDYVAVPNLINIVARQEYQGVGDNETAALKDCLGKIKGRSIQELFPTREK